MWLGLARASCWGVNGDAEGLLIVTCKLLNYFMVLRDGQVLRNPCVANDAEPECMQGASAAICFSQTTER